MRYSAAYQRRHRCGANAPVSDLPLDYSYTLDEIIDSVLIPRIGLGSIRFAWGAGDANAPRIWLGARNVVDRLTLIGSPTPEDTPWVDSNGNRIQAERTAGGGARRGAMGTGPGAANDVVVITCAYPSALNVNAFVHSFYDAGLGVIGRRDGGGTQSLLYGAGGTLVVSGGATTSAHAWQTSVLIVDRAANVAVEVTSGQPGADVNIAALGSLGDAPAASIGYIGTANGSTHRVLICAWGAGLGALFRADTNALARRIARMLSGIEPRIGAAPTYARASAAAWQSSDGRLHLASSGLARAGDSLGVRLSAARTNKVYNTVNPAATTGWTATGGTHTAAVADATALAAAKLDSVVTTVATFAPGAGDEQIYSGAATGSTAVHSLSVYLRGAAGGESVDVCLRRAADGSLQVAGTATLTTAWVRYEFPGVTPAANDQAFALDVDAGDTIYHTLAQLEAGATCSTPIPNFATAATATRNAETLDLGESPDTAEGAIEAVVEALDFTGSTGDGRVITRATSDATILSIGTGMYQASDGTSTVTGAVGPALTTSQAVRTWWGPELGISTEGAPDTAAFDGTIGGTGAYRITKTGDGLVGVRRLRAYRRGRP